MKGQATFVAEWQTLIQTVDLAALRQHSLSGYLRDSRLRSIAWRIFLRVLPLDRTEWLAILTHVRRSYEDLKNRMNVDPRRQSVQDMYPNINNPLSLEYDNPWQRYFLDQELRSCIGKDVDRTFPELQFFQDRRTQDIMSNILFCYAKDKPHISYRQGMHEILAPILFVIYVDQQSYEHSKEENLIRPEFGMPLSDIEITDSINDPHYLEHDAYALFCQLMMLVEKHYLNFTEDDNDDFLSKSTKPPNYLGNTPFSSDENASVNESELLRKLDYIHEELLKNIDPDLYQHLNSLQIVPQIYGIRWLRLLFGREFPLHDLLYLWDVILADQPTFVLVDYIFVALLVQIRYLLLHGDYTSCIRYLMRYPPVADIHSFVQFVLHLKSPKKFTQPDGALALTHFSHITLAGKAHPNVVDEMQQQQLVLSQSPQRVLPSKNGHQQRRFFGKGGSTPLDNVLNKIGRTSFSSQSSSSFKAPKRQEAAPAMSNSSFYDARIYEDNDVRATDPTFSPSARSSRHHSKVAEDEGVELTQQISAASEIELMKEQISILQSRLNDFDLITQIASRRLVACANEIRQMDPGVSDERRRKVAMEIDEVAEQITRSFVPEEYFTEETRHSNNKLVGASNGIVEVASEAAFPVQAIQQPCATAAVSSSRLSSINTNKELVELSFSKRKNY